MKKHVFFLFTLLVIGQSAFAYSFSAVAPSGQTLYYNIENGVAKVTSQNNSSPYYTTYPTGALTIPSSVNYNGYTYPVTEISNGAFYECTGLTSVSIPSSVTSIGAGAFSDCISLVSITIPGSVTSIGEMAFAFCDSLSTAIFTGTIAQWCNINFSDGASNPMCCSGSLYINGNLVTNLVIPNGVTEIKQYTFAGCTSMTTPNTYW